MNESAYVTILIYITLWTVLIRLSPTAHDFYSWCTKHRIIVEADFQVGFNNDLILFDTSTFSL